MEDKPKPDIKDRFINGRRQQAAMPLTYKKDMAEKLFFTKKRETTL